MRYYEYGRLRALMKIGMTSDVGPISYAPSQFRNSDLGVENKKQDFWKSIDDEPSVTGNESGIGMPSPAKTGSVRAPTKLGSFGIGYSRPINQDDEWSRENRLAVNFGFPHLIALQISPGPMKNTRFHVGLGLTGPQLGYSFGPRGEKPADNDGKKPADSDNKKPVDTKTGSELGYGSSVGTYDIGGSDANQHLADRNKRLSDAMQNAFTANEQYDQSYAPEAASTQPYGPKLAAAAMRIAAPKPPGSTFGVPRLGGRPGGNTTMGMQPTPATTIKPPTALSPQHTVARNAFNTSRTNVHAQQPNAVGATGSRVQTTPTVVGGAPVNPVNMAPKMPDMTTTAPRV